MAFDLGNLLQQYLGGATTPSPQHVDNHFDQASQRVGGDLLGSALSAVFRSDQTPAFGQMAGQLGLAERAARPRRARGGGGAASRAGAPAARIPGG